MKTNIFSYLLYLLVLGSLQANAQITFGWENAIREDGADGQTFMKETISGITVTVTSPDGVDYLNCSGCMGTTEQFIGPVPDTATTVTFSFSEPVTVNTLLALDFNTQVPHFTFTPEGGTNQAVTVDLEDGVSNPVLNWTNITAFTVTSPAGTPFGFDNLVINDNTGLSVADFEITDALVYPNPVKNILYLDEIEGLKKIELYDSLGKLVLKTTQNKIDFSFEQQDFYLLKIYTDKGIQVKKIIKN